MKTIHVSGELLPQPITLTLDNKAVERQILEKIVPFLSKPLDRRYIWVKGEDRKRVWSLEDVMDGQNLVVKEYRPARKRKIEKRIERRKARGIRKEVRKQMEATAEMLGQMSVKDKETDSESEKEGEDEEMEGE